MKEVAFTKEEMRYLIMLAATLDPATFKYPEARSVIEKCKAAVEQMPVQVSVLRG